MALVDVSYSIVGSEVTSIDLGVPVGTFPADGSQVDPDTNTPYDTGTLLVNDSYGFTTPVTTNQDSNPVVTVNSTQTWEVEEQNLRRVSMIFNRPTKFGRFRQAIDWVPVDQISAEWGKIQMIIGGIDVTYFRDHPAQMGPWTSNEPNGDAATSVFFPQISWWERPNYNDIAWIEGGKDATILLIRPNGTTKTLFEGLI